jgi:signal transduction histidine kinase
MLAALLGAAIGTALVLFFRLRRAIRATRELDSRLRQLERQLEEADEAKTRFLSSVTHELRTPLTAIIGYQELLADDLYGAMDERCRQPLERIGSAAEHLLHLIDGVLEVARIDAGRAELRIGRVPLHEHVQGAIAAARTTAEQRGVTIQTEIPTRLPRITTDPERLARLFDLALTAAIQSCANLTVNVRVRPQEHGAILEVHGTNLPLQLQPARDHSDSSGEVHVLKGGSFTSDVVNATYFFHGGGPGNGYDVGFRVVMEMKE